MSVRIIAHLDDKAFQASVRELHRRVRNLRSRCLAYAGIVPSKGCRRIGRDLQRKGLLHVGQQPGA
ncbi:hypothetical protein RmaAA213_05130 [Rhodothermus marinus]|nr:hypothetical protein RmaAA213_05130 [Rhodothermus marinus]BBM71646.1 hypothetical protein RmaAA338_05110 [Rhodothermus marinus]